KRFFIQREAEILQTKIRYKSTLFLRSYEVYVDFENLSRYKESYFLNRANFFVPVIVLGILSFSSFMWRNDKDYNLLLWLVFGILFLVAVTIYAISLENLWKVRVDNNTYLFFLKTNPDSQSVNHFLDDLFKTRDSYLRDTYFLNLSKHLSYESQQQNLQWLR